MNSKNTRWAIVCVLLFIFGFVLGRMDFVTPVDDVVKTLSEEVQRAPSPTTASGDAKEIGTAGTPISSSLTDGQRAMLKSFGLDPDTVTVTPEMISCAEGKVGGARIEEIKNGATPSFLEGASLLGCYTQ